LATYLIASTLQFLELDDGIIQVLLLTVVIFGLFWAASNLIYFKEQLNIAGIIGRYLSSFKSLAVLFKSEFWLTIVVIYLWRRGLSIARYAVGPRFVMRAFKNGVLALIAAGIVAVSLGRSLPIFEAALFLFSSLIAMGGARLSSLSRLRGGKGIPFEREWVVGLTLLAIGLLAFAGGVGLLAGGPLLGSALAWFIRFIEPFFQGLQADPIEMTTATSMQEAIESLEEIQGVTWAPQLGSILSTALAIVSVSFLFWIILYTVRKYRRGQLTQGPQEVERIRLSGSVVDYLRALLQGRAKRAIEGISSLNPAERFIAATRIRRIYAGLLKLSARLGEPRSPSDTPLEFMETLEKILPDSQEELATGSVFENEGDLMMRPGNISRN